MNKALFKENIKRFWLVSAVAALMYFMCGPFYLLVRRENASVFTAKNVLSNYNVGFVFLNCAVPVVICVAVFMYLYKMNSAAVTHALPFSRTGLFVTNAVSGLVLSWAPLAVNALIMLVMKLGNVLNFTDLNALAGEEGIRNISWSFKGILLWLAVSMVEMLFIFAISSFGAVISGNAIISLLTCCALNLVVQGCILAHFAYCSTYLYGYNEGSVDWTIVGRLHPVTYFIMNNMQELRQAGTAGKMSLLLICCAYTAVALVIAVLAWAVYKKRPNERTGDSYVFDSVGFIIGLLLVFLGTSAVGLIFNDSFGIWGFIVSGICCFIVAQMIIRKTPRIFDKGILRPLLASVVMMALVIGCYALDLTGYETRVPKASDVKKATVQNYSVVYGQPCVLEDTENIEHVTALHRLAVSKIDEYEKAEQADSTQPYDVPGEGQEWYHLDFEYELKSGRTMSRRLKLNAKDMLASEDLKAIVLESRSKNTIFRDITGRFAEASKITADCWYNDWNPDAEKYAADGKLPDDMTLPTAEELEELNQKLGKALANLSREELLAIVRAVAEDYEALPFEALASYPRFADMSLHMHAEYDSFDQDLFEELEDQQGRIYYIWHRSKTAYEKESYVETLVLDIDENWPRTLAMLRSIAGEND